MFTPDRLRKVFAESNILGNPGATDLDSRGGVQHPLTDTISAARRERSTVGYSQHDSAHRDVHLCDRTGPVGKRLPGSRELRSATFILTGLFRYLSWETCL